MFLDRYHVTFSKLKILEDDASTQTRGSILTNLTAVLNTMQTATGQIPLIVTMYFPSNEVETFTEQWSYDLTQLIGEMGGSIGLFLGLSLLSVVAGFEMAGYSLKMVISGTRKR